MKSHGASPFRTSMVEIGHGIAALKAQLFEKLMLRLERELRGSSRVRNGTDRGRQPSENLRSSRVSGSATATHGTIR
jgi:hypothetical protein